jgi:hypothetical protein
LDSAAETLGVRSEIGDQAHSMRPSRTNARHHPHETPYVGVRECGGRPLRERSV